MVTTSADNPLKEHPATATAVLSVAGYALVIGTFLGIVPERVFPDLSLLQMNLLSDTVTAVNTANVLVIAAGRRWIRRDKVRKCAATMVMSFGLILVFLVMYLARISGGSTKELVSPAFAYYPYLAMLAIHIILSIVSVPVVLYTFILGITHSERELRTGIPHRKVGRITAGAWLISLALGVVTYLLLDHVYSWEYAVTAVKSAGALLAPIVGI